MGKVRRLKKCIALFFFYGQKHNPCWTSCWNSGGDPMIPHTFSLTPDRSRIPWRSGWDRTSNLWSHEAVLLPLSHRSLVWTCAGTNISLFTWMWFYNMLVKAGIEPATSEPWGSALTTKPQISCLNMCRNLCFTIQLYVTWDFTINQLKVTHWAGVWSHDSIATMSTTDVCLPTAPSWLLYWEKTFGALC